MAVLCMLYKIRCNPMHPLYDALSVPYCGLHGALRIDTPMRLLAAEPRSIAGLLFPCQYLCRTILVTPCSMVWDWRVSRAGPMPFGPAAHSLFVSCCIPFLFFHSMGWCCGVGVFGVGVFGLIALSQPCITNLF